MKPSAALRTPQRTALKQAPSEPWRERAGALFAEFERPALALLRRAFRGAFSPEELDDIYASAWVGTLRALSDRHAALADHEIRSYVLTAVANQAGKELRRRKRKPTSPLESEAPVADTAPGPDEQALEAEESKVTRDLLASLPRRRRTVILLRYGWGLEPKQICELVSGLSPRAYRKEITRGVDELTEKMRAFERGDWCADREPVLKAFAAGLADEEQVRQAKAHIAHCRDCSEFVGRLKGHLHDLGAAAAVPWAVEELDDRIGIGEHVADGVDRVRETLGGVLGRGATGAEEAAVQIASSGGARGAGVAGAGVIAKLAAAGTAGKVAMACVGGGVAATACIAAGVGVPGADPDRPQSTGAAAQRDPDRSEDPQPAPWPHASDVAEEPPAAGSDAGEAAPQPQQQQPHNPEPANREPQPPPEPTTPVAPQTPAVQQEFGAPAAAAPAPAPSGSTAGSATASSSGSGAAAVRQEFGP